jgi:dTDP-4-dehydrorhamnose reductase
VKLLVTGSQGQLARSIAERARDYPALDIYFTARPEVDLARAGSLATAIEASRPDVLINAAAYTNVEKAEEERDLARRINADAAGEAAVAAASVGAAIIQISTDYVFDGRLDRSYREGDPVNPINVYGETKAAGEEQVRSANARHIILRTSWIISPFGRNFVKTIVEAARTRDRLTVVDDQRGRPTSALDLAGGLLSMVQSLDFHGETYHLAGAGQAMEECRGCRERTADIVPIRSSDWPVAATRPANSVLDCSRIAEQGVELPNWRASIPLIVQRIIAEQ